MITIHLDGDGVYIDNDGVSIETHDQQSVSAVRSLARSIQGTASGIGASTRVTITELGWRAPGPGRGIENWRPTGKAVNPHSQGVDDLPGIGERRSAHSYSEMRMDEALRLLHAVCRVRDATEDDHGFLRSHRLAPSAGGRHPIHCFLACWGLRGLERGLYWYDPMVSRLLACEAEESTIEALLNEVHVLSAAEVIPPAAIYLVGEMERTLSRYPRGVTHVLLDAGMLAGVMQLTASAMGLASRFVSIGPRSPLLTSLGLEPPEFFVIGAIECGSP